MGGKPSVQVTPGEEGASSSKPGHDVVSTSAEEGGSSVRRVSQLDLPARVKSKHAFGPEDSPLPTRLAAFQSSYGLTTSVRRLTKYRSAIMDGYMVDPPELLPRSSCTWLQPLKPSADDAMFNVIDSQLYVVCCGPPFAGLSH